jgi:hypothetical protein
MWKLTWMIVLALKKGSCSESTACRRELAAAVLRASWLGMLPVQRLLERGHVAMMTTTSWCEIAAVVWVLTESADARMFTETPWSLLVFSYSLYKLLQFSPDSLLASRMSVSYMLSVHRAPLSRSWQYWAPRWLASPQFTLRLAARVKLLCGKFPQIESAGINIL